MSDKNLNEWLFADMEDLIDCDYGEESDDENRMTDNEIIKALECCTTKGAKCSDCPAFKKVDRSDCKKYFRGAIDIINRQQAEIERLKADNKTLENVIKNTFFKKAGLDIDPLAEVKAEAIKEFAEKLKKPNRWREEDIYYIDNLVKEMVGAAE